MHREPLKDRAEGQWPSILSAVGIQSKFLRNRHGPCPMCDGKDRFRFDDKGGRGTWICSHCGAGDGIELVKRFLRLDFKDAAVEIEKHLGTTMTPRDHGTPDTDERQRQEMRAMWARAVPIQPDDFAGQYLSARTGITTFPPCLRYSKDERYSEPGARSTFHPAIIAAVMPCDAALADGETAALHRTYLGREATKADVSTPRKLLGKMPTGAAVRLMEPTDVLGIAEGIETAFSAFALHHVPTWAALNATMLEQWIPPEGLKAVFVFGDNDASNTGQAAAFGLAKRLKATGLEVFVEIPPVTGHDWNDVHMRRLEMA